MKDIQELINRIQQARAQSMSLPQEQLRALAEEYCRRCEEAAELVLYAYSLLRHKKKSAFLAFYRKHPHLVRVCELLDMRGRADWITITQFLGCPPPPDLPLKEAQTVRRAYEARHNERKKPETPAAAEEKPEKAPPEPPPLPPPLPEPVPPESLPSEPVPPEPVPEPLPVPLEERVLSLYETDGLQLPSPGDVEQLKKKEPAVREPLEILPEDVLPVAPPLPVVPPEVPEVVPPPITSPITPPPLPEESPQEVPDEDSQRFTDIFTPQPPEIPPPVTPPVTPPLIPPVEKPVKHEAPPETPKKPERVRRSRRRVLAGCVAMLCLLAGGGYFYLETHGPPLSTLINTITGKAKRPKETSKKASPEPQQESDSQPDEPKIRDIFAAQRGTPQAKPQAEPEKPRELIIPDTEEGRQTRARYAKAAELVARIPAAAEYESAEHPRLTEPCQQFFRELWPYRDLVDILPVSYTKKFRFVYEKTDNRWILRHDSDRAVPPRGDYVCWNEEGLQVFRRHEEEQSLFFSGVLVRTKAGPGLRPQEAFLSLFPRLEMVGLKPGAKAELKAGAKNTYDFPCQGLAYALALRDVPVALRANYFLEDMPEATVTVFSGETAPGGKVPVGAMDTAPTRMTLAPEPRSLPELERHFNIRYSLSVSPPELHVEIVPAESESAFSAKADRACRAEVARLLAALEESLPGKAEKYAQDAGNLLENLATLTEKQVRDTQNRWLQDELPDASVKLTEEIVTLLLHRLTVARKTFHLRMELHAAREGTDAGVPTQLPILDTRK